MLLISSHGRAAALDMRLIGYSMARGESKIEAGGQAPPSARGFQIVFCDLSTPKPDECRRRRPGSSTSPATTSRRPIYPRPAAAATSRY